MHAQITVSEELAIDEFKNLSKCKRIQVYLGLLGSDIVIIVFI